MGRVDGLILLIHVRLRFAPRRYPTFEGPTSQPPMGAQQLRRGTVFRDWNACGYDDG